MPKVFERESSHAPQVPSRPARGTTYFLVAIFLVVLASVQSASAVLADPVTLTWDPSPTSTVTGYRVFYGVINDGPYFQSVEAGGATTVTIPGLIAGVTYYFVVSAYDASGMESEFSNEVTHTATLPVLLPAIPLTLQLGAAGQITLNGLGQIGRSYDIQASTDLRFWQVIGEATAGVGGLVSFTDTQAKNYPQRFYRILESQLTSFLQMDPSFPAFTASTTDLEISDTEEDLPLCMELAQVNDLQEVAL